MKINFTLLINILEVEFSLDYLISKFNKFKIYFKKIIFVNINNKISYKWQV
jgi:hypothetical protein